MESPRVPMSSGLDYPQRGDCWSLGAIQNGKLQKPWCPGDPPLARKTAEPARDIKALEYSMVTKPDTREVSATHLQEGG